MRHTVLCVSAVLVASGIATRSAAADDRDTCGSWQVEEAIAACSRLISRNPDDAGSYANRGTAYFAEGDYDRAIADYGEAIRLDPKSADVYYNRGNVWQSKGENDHAIADFDQAIRLDPKTWITYYSRGNAYYGKHDYDHAIADYDQAIWLHPNYPNAYDNRGNAYSYKHDYDQAIADYGEAIRLDPKRAAAYNDRGNAYLDGKHDYDLAIADYGEAIRLDPKNAITYTSRGNAYRNKHDYDHAIADYDQAIRLDPKSASAYVSRGRAYEDGKHYYNRALFDYDQSLRLDPNNTIAREGRERVQTLLTMNRPGPAQALRPPQTSPSQPVTSAIPSERRVALVIGNSGYTSSLVQALPNPRRDARLVADALRQIGFEVMELVDLDLTGMVKALQAFRDKADSAGWALVYFAGHGIEINRVNYLLPVDAKLADSRDVELEAVSYEAVLNAIGGAKALRIIVLDACRNNPFKAQMHQTVALRGSLDRGLAAPPETEPGTLVVYSAKEGQAAVDGDGVNSPFALAFVARLKMPGREVRRMFDDVRDDVLEATSKRQQPYTYGSLPGRRDFFFVAGR